MTPKKKKLLILLNSAIVLINIALFSNALFGFSLFNGTPLSLSIAWTVVIASVFAFIKGNSLLFKREETHLLTQSIHSLNDCIHVFQEAMNNGDVFDESMLRNIEQIKRFTRKHATIKDILLQKFSKDELSFQKFSSVLDDVENVIYMNMRSILNKISAFDEDEYLRLTRGEFASNELTKEKQSIFNEYIEFVDNATRTNEEILLKLDKMLLEISRYNSIDGGDIKKLPAILEMDELIKNANLYK
ncbi:MAG: hypothetical protein LBS36_04615 [Oscillospiraceae bacterium]|jgi:uncharacterized membrane protein|nr:hypothetical protein [Oscillospiraceae bacterium]